MAYGWHVQRVSDANDLELLQRAFENTQQENRPSLIIVDSHIAWGSPNKMDTHGAHGEPLGVEEVRLTKEQYGWPPDAQFLVPEEVRAHTMKAVERGQHLETEWERVLQQYRKAQPELAKKWATMQEGHLPEGWDKEIPVFPADAKGLASRDSGAKVLNAIAKNVPWLIGGAADLAPSTKTRLTFDGAGDFEKESYGGRNFHFGIREHAMGAILNGMALSKLRPYGSGFLIFSDYMRAPIRLSALMDQPVIYVFTHDSIGVGEDGPTHQPIEQLMSLRAIPRLIVIRPGDANEVAEAWRVIMHTQHEPLVLVLSRQALPTIDRAKYASAAGLRQGAYIIADCEGEPEVILMGTGSELQLCVGAYEKLSAEGHRVRALSMPSWEIFEKQPQEYKDHLLPPRVRARVAVEAGTSLGWKEYIGLDGKVVARRDFGASAPIKDLLTHFGFTVDHVVAEAKGVMSRMKKG
jgi:transketolase